MCGIFGIFKNKHKKISINKDKILSLLYHRGPDGNGEYENEDILFLHTRLSIVDLKYSSQPIYNEDRTVLVIYNGELYNFKELKIDLINKGHRFNTKGDTEVLVHLYEEYGLSFIEKLNGMFAFALYDLTKKKLILARDRFGIKPLYYSSGENFIFASEIKPILVSMERSNDINFTALWQYFTFQNIIDNTTLFKDISIVEPGEFIVINNKGIKKHRYFELNFTKEDRKWNISYEVQKLRYYLDNSIQKQLISDVEVGTYLSGGIDSSTISYITKNYVPELKSFNCGFNITNKCSCERAFDESKFAEELADEMGINFKKVILNKNSMQKLIYDVVYNLEDLRAGICYQNYAVAGIGSKYVKVILSGTGGDDLLGGYPWRYDPALGSNSGNEFAEKFYNTEVRFFDDKLKQNLFRKDVLRKVKGFSTFDLFCDKLSQINSDDYLNTMLTYEAKTFLHGLLIVEDRMSMAHSVKVRVPFLEYDFVDLISKFPSEYKYDGKTMKKILIKSLKNNIPDQLFSRPKQGFITPDNTWFREPGNLKFIRKILFDKKSMTKDIFDNNFIKDKIIDRHINGQSDYRFLIWSLLCFEIWCRYFLK